MEEAYGDAMVHRAERQRKRRRLISAATIAVALAVAMIMGILWSQSEAARAEATIEALRAEAANLFSLAQLRLEDHPTAAIAYATASLELTDNPEVRHLALKALWRGPTEFRLPTASPYSLDFSPDGHWLATADPGGGGTLWPSDGGPPTFFEGSDDAWEVRFSPRGDLVAASTKNRQELGLWSVPEGRFLRSLALGDQSWTAYFDFFSNGERIVTSTEIEILKGERIGVDLRSWLVEGGKPDLLARLESPTVPVPGFDPTGSRFAWADGHRVLVARLDDTTLHLTSATSVEHDQPIERQIFDEQGRQLATADTAGTIRIWALESDPPELIWTANRKARQASFRFDASGSLLSGGNFATGGNLLWDLGSSPSAEPQQLRSPGGFVHGMAFDPNSDWLATSAWTSVSLWPLARSFPQVLRGHDEGGISGVVFTPDGKRLVSTSGDGSVRVWSLASFGEPSRILHQFEGNFSSPSEGVTMAPDGSFVAVGNPLGLVKVLPFDGSDVRELVDFVFDATGKPIGKLIRALAVDPQSRFVAYGAGSGVRVRDLLTGQSQILDAGDGETINHLQFTGNGDLWVASGPKLRRWQLNLDPPRVVAELDLSVPDATGVFLDDLSPDGRLALLGGDAGRLWIQDLDTSEARELSSHAERVGRAIFDPTGEIVVSSAELGVVRVGLVLGGDAHFLLGHQGEITALAVSPDGRWVASGATDKTIRLWPMPDLDKPPLHTLPHDELIAKLQSLTNLRAVRDPESSTGWKIEIGPFPGWEEVPTW